VSTELRKLRDRPFELLVGLDDQLRAARFEAAAGQVWTGLAFRIGDDGFVAPREDVREVLPPPELTHIPAAQDWLLGVANVRGSLLPVCDLRLLAGYPVSPRTRSSRVIVLNSDRVPLGFLVDEVAGHRQFVPVDQKHRLADEAPAPLADWLLGAFVRDGEAWRILSLQKLSRAETLAQAGH
jgi:twitching motility protein PilI